MGVVRVVGARLPGARPLLRRRMCRGADRLARSAQGQPQRGRDRKQAQSDLPLGLESRKLLVPVARSPWDEHG
jgi:hypothetical protein